MTGILSAIFYFIVAVGLLVVFHEYGHYWAARKLGVKVLRFSVGFGKPLWRGRRGETEYVVAAIPLGGYVKMLDEREGEVPKSELARAFNRQPVYSRFAIVTAGPLFNFLLAAIFYWAIFVAGVPGIKPVVGNVESASIAGEAGFKEGDVIVMVGDEDTPTWDTVVLALLDHMLDGKTVTVTVRDTTNREMARQLSLGDAPNNLARANLLKTIGIEPSHPRIPARIDGVIAGGAAERAGLASGDEIVAADGQQIDDWEQWVKIVRAHPEKPMEVLVQRDGQRIQLDVRPDRASTEEGDIGQIGATVKLPDQVPAELRAEVRYSPLAAVGAAIAKTWDMSLLTLHLLGKMVTGQVSLTNISGPISIAQYASFSASAGIVPFLAFLAIISVSLGVLNLLPIPILDGGHLFYYVIEIIKGSPVSEKVEILGQRIGILLLGMLMFVAFYNDLARLLK